MAIVGVVLLVAAAVLLWIRRSQQSKLFEISSTQTSTCQQLLGAAKYVAERLGEAGSFNELAEVKGVVKCDAPLTSKLAQQPCVYYSMSVTREYEEDYWDTDPQSKERVRKTRRQSESVASNSQRVPFWVEDGSGRILVDPDHADLDAVQVVDRFDPAQGHAGGAVLSFGGFSLDVGNLVSQGMSSSRTLGYRFRESLLPLERRVYVLGEARDASGQLEIGKPREKGKRFLVSLKSEEELIRSTGSAILWLLVAAVASGVVGVGLILAALFAR